MATKLKKDLDYGKKTDQQENEKLRLYDLEYGEKTENVENEKHTL
ncbi:hypothetical protein T09_6951 [Trichinella sp. T9]|nr:hypothetical protein T09_6951 [Trichinella sp. T9]